MASSRAPVKRAWTPNRIPMLTTPAARLSMRSTGTATLMAPLSVTIQP